MKKAIFIIFASLVIPFSAAALTIDSRDTLLSSSDHTVTDVFLGAGGQIDAAATYQDDLILAGANINITGPVKGDVIVVSGNVKISGAVDGSVRAAGGVVEINGLVGRNVMVGGGSVTFGKDSDIRGEVTVVGGTLRQDGAIAKALNYWGGAVILNGQVDGAVKLHTGQDCDADQCVVIGPNAKLGGDLTYWATNDAEIQTGANITGQVVRHQPDIQISEKTLTRVWTGLKLWSLFSILLVGIVIALFFPRTIRQAAETMVRRTGPAIGFGLLLLFAGPLALLILATTLVGIPLALILAAFYVILLYASQIWVGYYFGHVIIRALRRGGPPPENRWSIFWATVVGIIVVSLIFDFLLSADVSGHATFITFLGGVVKFGLVVWSFGAFLVMKWQHLRESTNA